MALNTIHMLMNPKLDLMPNLSHLHIFISNCQCDIFIWVSNRHMKFNETKQNS